MKAFIWENVSELTDNYHSGGGLVVVAETIEDAEDAVKKKKGVRFPISKPDLILFVVGASPRVFVFPNAGCCS